MSSILCYFLGRLLIGVFMLALSGMGFYFWDDGSLYLKSALEMWQQAPYGMMLDRCIRWMMNNLHVVFGVLLSFKLLSGLSIFLGFKTKFGAFLLFLVIAFETLVYHPFWIMHGEAFFPSFAQFVRNLAVLGGGFLIFAYEGIKHLR